MYPIREFQEGDREAIIAFLHRYPLAMLTGTDPGGRIVATHVPLLVHATEPDLVLRGHIMRKTDYWNALKQNPEALAAFTGPDAPILASWQSVHPFGGTWNYMAAHARGQVTFLPESDLLALLETLKNRFEESPDHTYANLPEEYINRLAPGIECLEIRVTELEAVFKLSQNRQLEEFDSTIRHLLAQGGPSAQVAEEMLSRRSTYFPDLAPS